MCASRSGGGARTVLVASSGPSRRQASLVEQRALTRRWWRGSRRTIKAGAVGASTRAVYDVSSVVVFQRPPRRGAHRRGVAPRHRALPTASSVTSRTSTRRSGGCPMASLRLRTRAGDESHVAGDPAGFGDAHRLSPPSRCATPKPGGSRRSCDSSPARVPSRDDAIGQPPDRRVQERDVVVDAVGGARCRGATPRRCASRRVGR